MVEISKTWLSNSLFRLTPERVTIKHMKKDWEKKELRAAKKEALLLKPYEKKWVALSRGRKRVLASGTTLGAVMRKLSREDRKQALFKLVLPFTDYYIPLAA